MRGSKKVTTKSSVSNKPQSSSTSSSSNQGGGGNAVSVSQKPKLDYASSDRAYIAQDPIETENLFLLSK